MEITTLTSINQRKKTDLLLIPIYKSKKGKDFLWPKETTSFQHEFEPALSSGDFKGKEGEVLLHYVKDLKANEKRVLLLGLGEEEEITLESLRRSFGSALKALLKLKCKAATVTLPDGLKTVSKEEELIGALEGLLLPNYKFDQLKHESKDKEGASVVEKLYVVSSLKSAKQIAEKTLEVVEGVFLARDLVNGNADEVTPSFLAKVAHGIAKEHTNVKTTVYNRKELEKMGLGLLVAVGRGSHHDPHLIIVEYNGNKAHKKTQNTIIVGKGVTYDTGGLNLKPTGSMETMKCDMGGAAAALATVSVAAALNLKVNVTAVVPTTENSIDALSYKPGDVYKSYLGKTVEIGNTDAEGRLILADALAYAVKNLHPTEIIDLATLTGAIDIALGSEAAGLFSNNDALAKKIEKSGEATFERVWRMPLFKEYRDLLKSEIADMKNHGGRSGGAILGAHFLHDFVGNVPWAHLDIASTAYLGEPKRYIPRHGTGYGVRLLVDYLQHA